KPRSGCPHSRRTRSRGETDASPRTRGRGIAAPVLLSIARDSWRSPLHASHHERIERDAVHRPAQHRIDIDLLEQAGEIGGENGEAREGFGQGGGGRGRAR